MSRKIKFRAWDENWKCGTMRYFGLGEWLTSEMKKVVDFNDVPVMQFTGLKDKNGKEIYEGDIIQTDEITWRVLWGKSPETDQTGWLAECIAYEGKKRGGKFYGLEHSICKGEVIGNVFENPELLNGNTNDERGVTTKLNR